jgi:hypothetical protein
MLLQIIFGSGECRSVAKSDQSKYAIFAHCVKPNLNVVVLCEAKSSLPKPDGRRGEEALDQLL